MVVVSNSDTNSNTKTILVLCSYSDAEVLLTVQMDFASISRVISSYCIYCEIFL